MKKPLVGSLLTDKAQSPLNLYWIKLYKFFFFICFKINPLQFFRAPSGFSQNGFHESEIRVELVKNDTNFRIMETVSTETGWGCIKLERIYFETDRVKKTSF